MTYRRLHTLTLSLVLLGLAACAGAQPNMTVLGVKSPSGQPAGEQVVNVFVEVDNPTGLQLSLQRMEYRFVAENWFDTRGTARLQRVLSPGGKVILKIQVPIREPFLPAKAHGVPYSLKARLIATTDSGKRSWQLSASGALATGPRGQPTQVAEYHAP